MGGEEKEHIRMEYIRLYQIQYMILYHGNYDLYYPGKLSTGRALAPLKNNFGEVEKWEIVDQKMMHRMIAG